MYTLRNFLIVFAIIVVFIAVFYFYKKNKENKATRLDIEEGSFIWLEQNDWHLRPIIPLSDTTILGTCLFGFDRYDSKLDSLSTLYGGRTITDKQAWVIRGVSAKVIKYWSFSLFKLNDKREKSLQPVGYSINNEMVKDSRNGDDLVLIISPNYKLAEAVANQIHQKEYRQKLGDDKYVIFRYFPIPNYDASAKYTFLYEAARNNGGALPKIIASRYTYSEKDQSKFPFFPVEKGKEIDTINEDTLDENKTLGNDPDIFDRQIEKQIDRYTFKKISTFLPIHHSDYIYTDSGPIDVSSTDSLIVGVADHSSNGKCLYSEIIFVDDIKGKVYYSANISDINGKIKIKIFTVDIPYWVTRVRVYERIVVDMSTKIRPDAKTIITARTYVTSLN
jgi:hypothetical protein